MRTEKEPDLNKNRDYIPNDEIDQEEKLDIRQQKKANVFSVLLGGVVVISLIAFLFVLLDSGILSGETQRLYGSSQTSSNAGGELTQEEKKAAEEEARKAEEEAKQKKREEEEAKRAEEEAARKAQQEEEKKAREEEEKKRAEERAKKQAEIDEKEAERKKELEEEQEVLSGDYILPESNSRYYSEEEIEGLTDREVLFALNEIYARRGRIFAGEEFRRYFESKSWYNGTIPPEEFDANQNERFNEYEKANISLLVRIAQERGIR